MGESVIHTSTYRFSILYRTIISSVYFLAERLSSDKALQILGLVIVVNANDAEEKMRRQHRVSPSAASHVSVAFLRSLKTIHVPDGV